MIENEKITVGFFLPSLEPGGTERNVIHLVNTINKSKYNVSLILGKKEGDFVKEVPQDIAVTNLDASYSIRLFFKLITYLKYKKPDIFVSSFPRINIICIAARSCVRVRTKIMITEHSIFSLLPVIAKTPWRRTFARFFMPILAKLLYPMADSIVCVSNGIATDLKKIVNAPGKIKVIYNPIINETIYRLAQEPVNHRWFLDRETPVILSVGRLVACKDYPTLLRAFKLVIEKQPAHLVVLGSGPEKQKLIDFAKKINIFEYVAFLGFQENPYKYMAKASVFVLSSLQEGFGNVIIEAMASGVPVVSTNCPTGPGEIIEHMKNGILVPVNDEKTMATAMLKILNNPALAEEFSEEGGKKAKFFSVKKSVEEYEKVFQTVLYEKIN